MRLKTITFSCITTLLIAGYAIHAGRESKFRHKLGIPANASVRDLGEVTFSEATPISFQLGSGQDLTVLATSVTNKTQLASVPAAFTNGVLQISLSYTSRLESISGKRVETHMERQTLMYPQRGLLALTLAKESSSPVAVLMRPRLTPQ
jgi:hypothetical protein